jgi:hypothetical protein
LGIDSGIPIAVDHHQPIGADARARRRRGRGGGGSQQEEIRKYETGERAEGIQIETYASSLRREKEDERRVTAAIESIDERQSLLRQDCPIEAKGRPGPHNRKGLNRI